MNLNSTVSIAIFNTNPSSVSANELRCGAEAEYVCQYVAQITHKTTNN